MQSLLRISTVVTQPVSPSLTAQLASFWPNSEQQVLSQINQKLKDQNLSPMKQQQWVCWHNLARVHNRVLIAILWILSQHKWHLYKVQLLQHLNKDDPDRWVQFAEWVTQQLQINPRFPYQVLFSDEANFFINGEVNKQNHRYWSDTNPHWIDASRMVDSQKVIVWCGLWGYQSRGTFFYRWYVNSQQLSEVIGWRCVSLIVNGERDISRILPAWWSPTTLWSQCVSMPGCAVPSKVNWS